MAVTIWQCTLCHLHKCMRFSLDVQSFVGEREKQIILKTQPPPIEVHLKNEDYDLMTVSPFTTVSLSL